MLVFGQALAGWRENSIVCGSDPKGAGHLTALSWYWHWPAPSCSVTLWHNPSGGDSVYSIDISQGWCRGISWSVVSNATNKVKSSEVTVPVIHWQHAGCHRVPLILNWVVLTTHLALYAARPASVHRSHSLTDGWRGRQLEMKERLLTGQ